MVDGGHPERLTFHTAWGSRLTGLVVLLGASAGALGLAITGGAPLWTWLVLAAFAIAAAVATVANFGDRFHFDDEGLAHENVVLTRLGFPGERRAAWKDVVSAVEHDKATWFVNVDGQGRWVLDKLDGHESVRGILAARNIPITSVERPRLLSRSPTDAR